VALSPTERDHSPKRLSKDNRVPLSPFLRADHEAHRRTASREAARHEEDYAQPEEAEPAQDQEFETSPISSAERIPEDSRGQVKPWGMRGGTERPTHSRGVDCGFCQRLQSYQLDIHQAPCVELRAESWGEDWRGLQGRAESSGLVRERLAGDGGEERRGREMPAAPSRAAPERRSREPSREPTRERRSLGLFGSLFGSKRPSSSSLRVDGDAAGGTALDAEAPEVSPESPTRVNVRRSFTSPTANPHAKSVK
jgi:hypothetical protein